MTPAAAQAIAGEEIQERTSKAMPAIGTRLRRKLSKIFQRLIADSLFGPRRPPARGTLGKSQSTICQSPRIQRC